MLCSPQGLEEMNTIQYWATAGFILEDGTQHRSFGAWQYLNALGEKNKPKRQITGLTKKNILLAKCTTWKSLCVQSDHIYKIQWDCLLTKCRIPVYHSAKFYLCDLLLQCIVGTLCFKKKKKAEMMLTVTKTPLVFSCRSNNEC